MAITLPIIGSPSWGSPVNNALTVLAHTGFNASDQGIATWAYDPIQCSTSAAPVSGVIRMVRMPKLVDTRTISSVGLHTMTGSTGGTSGQNFVGIYDSAGTRLAVSADLTTSFAASGVKILSLASPITATPGTYYVAVLVNATTPATFSMSSTLSTGTANWGMTLAASRFANGPAAQTTLPATITMASLTTSPQTTWAAIF